LEINPNNLESLVEKIQHYGNSVLQLWKLKFIHKSIDLMAGFISGFIGWIIIFLCLMLANLGLSFWLGEILGKTYLGFFAVSSFYFLMALLYFVFFKSMARRIVANSLVTDLTDNDE
jgi:hypothetical protein